MSKKYERNEKDAGRIETLVGFGWSHADIARIIINPETGKGIDPKLMRKLYRQELDVGMGNANEKVLAAYMKNCTTGGKYGNGDVGAQIFWMKARLRWRETPVVERVEVTGANGGPILVADDAKRARALAAFIAKTRIKKQAA